MLDLHEAYILFAFFVVGTLLLVWWKLRTEHRADGFLVADRAVSVWRGAFSIAVSWIWAPAIFICSMQAYTKGVAGVFWFTAPNILCFFVFAFVARRLRQLMPEGYTLPGFIWQRYGGDKLVHGAFLLIAFGYQLGAVVINAVAGGTLLNLMCGIDVHWAIIGMVVFPLTYSLASGLKASIFTDIIHMAIVLIFAGILVPWTVSAGGGLDMVTQGLAGLSGKFGNIFDPGVAWTMGIPMTISLISGPLSDQMFYQRAMAVKQENIMPVFVRGGLLFGMVPVMLSVLGFVGVTLARQGGFEVPDPQMVGPLVVAHLLPRFATYLFILMAFAGLCSTMDSSFCAISALGSISVFKHHAKTAPSDRDILRVARYAMAAVAVVGGALALLQPQLLWMFFINGALVGAGLVPTLAAIFLKHITAKDLCLSIVLSLVVSVPLSAYANISGDQNLNVIASLSGVVIGAVTCLLARLMNARSQTPGHNGEFSETGEYSKTA